MRYHAGWQPAPPVASPPDARKSHTAADHGNDQEEERVSVLLTCAMLGLGVPGAVCDRGGEALPLPRGGEAHELTPVEVGRQLAGLHGWRGVQWVCLYSLGSRESGWTVEKWNRAGSGAYGIGQALPARKMRRYGADYMTSARTQVRWMLAYIQARYGSPCNAWAHSNAHGYY